MPAVISREGPVAAVVSQYPAGDRQAQQIAAWRAVLRSWHRTHPQQPRREELEQIQPEA